MSNKRGGARPGAGRPKKSGNFAYPEFTIEQLKTLLDSQYVLNVSKKSVAFTPAFKQLFWQRYSDGIEPAHIFEDAGLPVKVITRDRINSFLNSLKAQVEKGQLLSIDTTSTKPTTPILSPTPQRRANNAKIPNLSEAEIANLLNQVSYMSQELAFLKKIISAVKEKE